MTTIDKIREAEGSAEALVSKAREEAKALVHGERAKRDGELALQEKALAEKRAKLLSVHAAKMASEAERVREENKGAVVSLEEKAANKREEAVALVRNRVLQSVQK